VAFYGKNFQTIVVEMLIVFDELSGKTSTDKYENYIKFNEYIEYFCEKEKDILSTLMENKKSDQSALSKHIYASLRINDFLGRCPQGAISRMSKIPISYFRKIDFENWNLVREELGLPKHSSKNWRDQIKINE
jgi:hypothetical protein